MASRWGCITGAGTSEAREPAGADTKLTVGFFISQVCRRPPQEEAKETRCDRPYRETTDTVSILPSLIIALILSWEMSDNEDEDGDDDGVCVRLPADAELGGAYKRVIWGKYLHQSEFCEPGSRLSTPQARRPGRGQRVTSQLRHACAVTHQADGGRSSRCWRPVRGLLRRLSWSRSETLIFGFVLQKQFALGGQGLFRLAPWRNGETRQRKSRTSGTGWTQTVISVWSPGGGTSGTGGIESPVFNRY